MKYISIKGILAGIIASIIIGVPNDYLQKYYFIYIYNDVMQTIDVFNKAEMQQLIYKVIYHPLTIIFVITTNLVSVGVPSYISALISNKAFVINASIIGLLVVVFYSSILGDFIIKHPILYTVSVIFTLLVSYFAGLIRQRQIISSNK